MTRGEPYDGGDGESWELTVHRAGALLSVLRETVMVVDLAGRVLYTNRHRDGILGYEPGGNATLPVDLVHPDEREDFIALIAKCGSTPGAEVSGQFRLMGADGDWQLVEGNAVNMVDDPAIGGVVIMTRNTSESASAHGSEATDRARRLRRLADHDPLTGIVTRTGIVRRLRHALEQRRVHGHPVAVLFVDLDGFRVINERYGHRRGDDALHGIADRFRHALTDGTTIGRMGGDEFVCIIESENAVAAAETTAKRLLDAIEAYDAPDGTGTISASIGIYIAVDANIDALTAIERADEAMYLVKSRGGGGFDFHDRPKVSQRPRA